MLRNVLAATSVAALLLTPRASTQSFSGTFVTPSRDGSQVTLTLRQDAGGRVTGSLVGTGARFDIEAESDGGEAIGLARSPEGAVYFGATLEGAGLRVYLADLGPDGTPRADAAREVFFQRQGAGAPAPAPTPGGNPLGRAPAGGKGAPAPAADPYSGTFAGGTLSLTLAQRGGGEYAGTLLSEGMQFPVSARLAGGRLVGSVAAQGVTYAFEAQLSGATMTVLSDGVTYQLQRQGAGQGAGAGMGSPAPQQQGQSGGARMGGTPQDQQLSQLLLSSRWCHFSYSAGSGYSGSGSEYRETVQFGSDGTVRISTGSESYYSGGAGSVAGQGGGGQVMGWRVQNGMLYLSPDGQQWQPVQLQVSQNSSGYPIITADGKEYAQCN